MLRRRNGLGLSVGSASRENGRRAPEKQPVGKVGAELIYRCTRACQVSGRHLSPVCPSARMGWPGGCRAHRRIPRADICVRVPVQVRSKPGYKNGSKVGALNPGEEVRVAELHATGSYLRISSMGTWCEGVEPRGWVPVSNMELAVQAFLQGKENATSPCLTKKKRQKSFVSPAKVVKTNTQTPRPTADGSLAAQIVTNDAAAVITAPKLFDDCGRPPSHPEHGLPLPARARPEDDVEVCFETRGSLGIAFCKQAGKIVVREVIAGGTADKMQRTSSRVGTVQGLRPGMVLRSVQGQPVAELGFAASMSLLSSAPRPLSLEFEKQLVKPLTPTKATGRSVTAACDAFFVAGMHTHKNAAVQMAELAREYVANGAKLLLSAENLAEDVAVPTHQQRSDITNMVEVVRQAELHFVSALRLAPANDAALTLLTEAENMLSDLKRRSDSAEAGITRTGSGGLKRTTSDAGLVGANDTDTLEISITAELSMMLAAPEHPGAGTSEPDSIKELLAQLKALDQHSSDEDDSDRSLCSSTSAAIPLPGLEGSVPMAQLLLDLQVLELEDELELLSSGTLSTPTSTVATPVSAGRSSCNSSVLCTPTAPEPTTEADSVPIDAMDFTAMMASWRLSNSPGAPAAQQVDVQSEPSSADHVSCPAPSDASRISRSASPSAVLEQDIVDFEQQLDSVAAMRSPQEQLPEDSESSTLTPCSPPAIVALPRSSHDRMDEELIGFLHTDSLATPAEVKPAARAQWRLCSPSDNLISPVTAAVHKGPGASVMLTAQRRLEMKSERDLMAIDAANDFTQPLDDADTMSQHQPAKQPRLNLTHANMPPLPAPAPVSTPTPAPCVTIPVTSAKNSQSPVHAREMVPKMAARFLVPADARAADSTTGNVECLESVAEATRASRNFWLEKERNLQRTQLVQRLNSAVIAASIIARARSSSAAAKGEMGKVVEQMVV